MQTESSTTLPKGSSKVVELALGGVKVKVKTDATPSSLKQIRDLVDSKCEEFAGKIERGMTPVQLLSLVTLSLAEDLLSEKERLKNLKRQVLEHSERLLDRVEAHLGRDS
ncbi:MAG: cell division protein ZapA [Bdellovibrionales bacterium]|nr:cell division protein ZapA [Bdellovibrionales bacterium]